MELRCCSEVHNRDGVGSRHVANGESAKGKRLLLVVLFSSMLPEHESTKAYDTSEDNGWCERSIGRRVSNEKGDLTRRQDNVRRHPSVLLACDPSLDGIRNASSCFHSHPPVLSFNHPNRLDSLLRRPSLLRRDAGIDLLSYLEKLLPSLRSPQIRMLDELPQRQLYPRLVDEGSVAQQLIALLGRGEREARRGEEENSTV